MLPVVRIILRSMHCYSKQPHRWLFFLACENRGHFSMGEHGKLWGITDVGGSRAMRDAQSGAGEIYMQGLLMSFMLEHPMAQCAVLFGGSEHALVYCTHFVIQPDVHRGPQRKSAGPLVRISWYSSESRRCVQGDFTHRTLTDQSPVRCTPLILLTAAVVWGLLVGVAAW